VNGRQPEIPITQFFANGYGHQKIDFLSDFISFCFYMNKTKQTKKEDSGSPKKRNRSLKENEIKVRSLRVIRLLKKV